MIHYSLYNIERFKKIRERKIQIHAHKIRNGYRILLSIAILTLFILPYAELIKASQEIYQTIVIECLIFNFSTLIVLILYYLVVSKFLPKYHIEDEDKRLRFFSDNQVRLMFIILFLIILMILMYAVLHEIIRPNKEVTHIDKFSILIKNHSSKEEYYTDSLKLFQKSQSENSNGFYTTYIVNQFILSVFLFYIIGIFSLTFHSLKSRLQRRIKRNIENDHIYIYWYNFQKSLILENPLLILSAVLFTILTISSFILRGISEISDRHFIYSVAFYSFWFASLTAIVAPFFIKIRILNTTFFNFTSHRLGNAILPSINDHIVVIGIGTLGSQLIENCFFDIHPEGYCVESFYPNRDKHKDVEVSDISDYDLIVNNQLELQLISRRIVVIENNDFRFSSSYSIAENKSIGIFDIAEKHNLNIGLLCIKGDANKNSILSYARCENSQVIVNTTPDSNLSLSLSTLYTKQKLILSVNSATAYEFLTSTTYDRAIFTIDSQQVEGIEISQMIFCWAFTNICNNLHYLRHKFNSDFDFESKILKFLRNNENGSINDFMKKIVKGGQGKILIAANGSYIYYIIQSIYMTLKFTFKMKIEEINSLLESKIVILTSDPKINGEIKNDTWKFYPIRDRNTSVKISYFDLKKETQLSIPTYYKDILNFDSYLEVFKKYKMGLVVLMNDKSLDAVKMFTEVANTIEIISNSSNNKIKPPHIIVYSLASDEIFLDSQFRKYYTFNINRSEKVGFPTQLIKESRISKDYISSNQLASMLRSIYVNKHLDDHTDEPIAEVIFSFIEKPRAIAYLVSKLCGLNLSFTNLKYRTPNFIYYFSTEMNIYKDTFIFKGTAKLDDCYENLSYEDTIRYCFINCDEKYRKLMEKVILNNLELIPSLNQNIQITNRQYDSGMFSHFPISSILRHPEIHFDILHSRKRFYVSNKIPVEQLIIDKKFKELNAKEKIMLFNIANFSVWSEGEETPGSYAGLLAILMFGSISNSDQGFDKNDYVPEILFSNNRPSFQIHDSNSTISQDSYYIKLVKKQVDYSNIHKNIRAIKLKLASPLLFENLDWSNYLFNLKNHLMYLGGQYSFYIVDMFFLEGTELEGSDGVSEVSVYRKVNSKVEMKNPIFEFQIIRRKIKDSNEINSYELNIHFDDEFNLHKRTRISAQAYKMILIREDLIENAKHEIFKSSKQRIYQNMLLVIEDL
ncbi:MAG: hypothetical protein JSS91_09100 [Bacteroidetes bacterium]|nr:hypothetical protein [Bacteroidota bacterium]